MSIYRIRLKRLAFIQWSRAFAIGLVAVMLAGCVYLRLLEVKNQLRDFDRFFQVEVSDQFALKFREPVLLDEDFEYLTGFRPTRTERRGGETIWSVDFQKLDAAGRVETPTRTLRFTMWFGADSKLTRFAFSPLFVAIAPASFLEASIRSMGRGAVDTDRRQLRVEPQDIPRINARLPTRRTIVDAIGEPAQRATIADGLLYVYRFRVDAQPVSSAAAKHGVAEAKLLFDPVSDELRKMLGQFVGLRLKIDYGKLTK